ncbi:MAG: START-like domain-containing protein [Bacteroidia bacterium]
MASAKNKKKAVATKKVIKKAAPKKVAKPVAKKPVKKVASKKVVKKAASAKTAVKSKVTVKKTVVATKKVVAVKQKAAANTPVKKVAVKAPVKKVVVNPSAPKPISKATAVKADKATPVKTDKVKASAAPVVKPKIVEKTPAPKSKKEVVEKKAVGKTAKPAETIDPLHAKAAKVMKELEETMDLSKMRPRIQAGTLPKPLPKIVAPLPSLPEPTNTLKEKYSLEFEFRSSPKILFTSLSDSSGLAGWFADEVYVKDKLFTFVWEGGHSNARLVAVRDLHLVRFEWEEDTDGTYFQFEIKEDDITLDIALVITDFANKGEKDTNIRLWESQVQKLRMLLGSL